MKVRLAAMLAVLISGGVAMTNAQTPNHGGDLEQRPNPAKGMGSLARLGPPFTENDLVAMLHRVEFFGQKGLIEMVEERGLAFPLSPSGRKRMERAGAGPALMEALGAASERPRIWNSPATEGHVALLPPLDEDGRRALLEQTRTNSLAYGAQLPDLTCLQQTRREVDFSGHGQWQSKDAIVERVWYNPKREDRQLVTVDSSVTAKVRNSLPYLLDEKCDESDYVIACKIVDTFRAVGLAALRLARLDFASPAGLPPRSSLVARTAPSFDNRLTDKRYEFPEGSSFRSRFVSVLDDIFYPERQTKFTWVGQGSLANRPVEIFEYKVGPWMSNWKARIRHTEWEFPEYRGRIWVDRTERQVLRITMVATEIPADSPIRTAEANLDYDYVRFPDRTLLLPLQASVTIRQGEPSTPQRGQPSKGVVTRSEEGFRGYRIFVTEQSITFPQEP